MLEQAQTIRFVQVTEFVFLPPFNATFLHSYHISLNSGLFTIVTLLLKNACIFIARQSDDYVACFKSLAKDKRWRASLRLLSEVKRGKAVQVNNYMYCSIISACGRCGEWERALMLLSEAKANACADRAVFNAALNACASRRRWEECVSIFDEMSKEATCVRSDALTPSQRGQQQQRNEDSKTDGPVVGVDILSYAAVISVCASCAQWGRAENLAKLMLVNCKGIGVVPAANIILAIRNQRAWHRALMRVVEKEQIIRFEEERKWTADDRVRIAEEIASTIDVVGDVKKSWSPGEIFVACSKMRKWELTESIMQQCLATSKPIDLEYMQQAIQNMSSMEDASMLIRIIENNDCRAGVNDMGCQESMSLTLSNGLATKAARLGLPEEAMRIMSNVINSELDPNPPAGPFNCIVRSFAARGDHEQACKVLYTMRDANIELNGGTIHASLNSIRSCSDWQLAMLIFESEHRKTQSEFEVLAETCLSAGKHDERLRVLKEKKRIRRLVRSEK